MKNLFDDLYTQFKCPIYPLSLSHSQEWKRFYSNKFFIGIIAIPEATYREKVNSCLSHSPLLLPLCVLCIRLSMADIYFLLFISLPPYPSYPSLWVYLFLYFVCLILPWHSSLVSLSPSRARTLHFHLTKSSANVHSSPHCFLCDTAAHPNTRHLNNACTRTFGNFPLSLSLRYTILVFSSSLLSLMD